ncbi:DUF1572 domain-containing protein [Oceanobacillus piezotolerans]|uniref:DUF1572 domain-containing protein n=1 Tax=Oceanobacillus piezotolerans TaxID=2448030 RepID=A0A498DL26_9BACI|nr:DUF1572 family protein [Oceanobacillus piezotolerans]RLL43679.1 DUF1572 domain-containing protein [Oceanobacillus piezotolerans]
MTFENEYLKVVQERFKDVKKLGDRTISQLSKEDLHWSLNDECNSIAIIIQHLSGNMRSRWTDFLTSDGEKPYRNRDGEFKNNIFSKQDLEIIWEQGWSILFNTLSDLRGEDMLRIIQIRSEDHTVIDAIERQMAHYAYHIGQMVYIGKQIKGKEWKTLSITKGESVEYLQYMQQKHKK